MIKKLHKELLINDQKINIKNNGSSKSSILIVIHSLTRLQ